MSAPRVKGLGEVRTAVATQQRAVPAANRRGQSFLDSYVLSRELKRLAQQLVPLDRQRERIGSRMIEIRQEMARLSSKRGDALPGDEPPARSAVGERPAADEVEPPGQTMTIGY